MQAKSKMQRKAALTALSVMKGEQSKAVLKGASKLMYETMNLETLTEMSAPRRVTRHRT